MKDEYIRKQDAIDDLHTQLMYRMGTDDMKRRLDDWVKTLPSADVVPVVHSRWVLGGYDDMYYVCEKCRHKQSEYYAKPTANFCPNCGAKMDGQGEE